MSFSYLKMKMATVNVKDGKRKMTMDPHFRTVVYLSEYVFVVLHLLCGTYRL